MWKVWHSPLLSLIILCFQFIKKNNKSYLDWQNWNKKEIVLKESKINDHKI